MATTPAPRQWFYCSSCDESFLVQGAAVSLHPATPHASAPRAPAPSVPLRCFGPCFGVLGVVRSEVEPPLLVGRFPGKCAPVHDRATSS